MIAHQRFAWAASLFVLACSADLSPRKAERQLIDHFDAVAPSITPSASLNVRVREILTLSDVARDVRFEVIEIRTDSTGLRTESSAGVMTGTFQKSNNGWSLYRYDNAMAEYVAYLMEHESEAEYKPLLRHFNRLHSIALMWKIEQLDEIGRAEDRGALHASAATLEDVRRGIGEAAMRARLEANKDTIARHVRWGIEESGYGSNVLWARLVADTAMLCAQRLGSARSLSLDYVWVDERSTTCRGGARTYFGVGTFDSAFAEIARNGWIVIPPAR